MKTIQITTESRTVYTINIKQISYFTSHAETKGCRIHLSCKTDIFTSHSVNAVLQMIERCNDIDLED